jgi:hypothetical protein
VGSGELGVQGGSCESEGAGMQGQGRSRRGAVLNRGGSASGRAQRQRQVCTHLGRVDAVAAAGAGAYSL